MAKGDPMSQQIASNGGNPPGIPKIDQYSVMHRLMDLQNGQGGSMAPTPGKQMPMPMGRVGEQLQPGPQMGDGGFNFGQYQHDFTSPNVMAGGLAPTNPTEMIRKQMMGNNVFSR